MRTCRQCQDGEYELHECRESSGLRVWLYRCSACRQNFLVNEREDHVLPELHEVVLRENEWEQVGALVVGAPDIIELGWTNFLNRIKNRSIDPAPTNNH